MGHMADMPSVASAVQRSRSACGCTLLQVAVECEQLMAQNTVGTVQLKADQDLINMGCPLPNC